MRVRSWLIILQFGRFLDLGKLLTKDIKPGKPRGRHARKPAPVNVDAVVEREVESKLEHARERERPIPSTFLRASLSVRRRGFRD